MPPKKRQYRAGFRDNPQLRGTGKMSENRLAWLRTKIGQFTIMQYDPSEVDNPDIGKSYTLFLPLPGGRPITFNITDLTTKELEMTRQFFDMLFDLAAPVVAERDRVADEALAAGDDSYERVYRAVPQFIVRKSKSGSHDQGVHKRSVDVPQGDGGDLASDDGHRRNGDELANSQSSDSSSEDDGSEADEPSGVQPMGGIPGDL